MVLVVPAKPKVGPLFQNHGTLSRDLSDVYRRQEMLQTYFFFFFSGCVQYNYRNRGSLTFEPLTLVPIQVKMINTALLNQKEVRTIQ